MIDNVRVGVGRTLVFRTVARPVGYLCVHVIVLIFSINAAYSAQVLEKTYQKFLYLLKNRMS